MGYETGTVAPLATDRPWAALGLVVGPVAFVGGWVLGGARTPGYRPVDDAISRFDQLERRVDYAEGRADALSIADGAGKPTLSDEIAALAGQDQIDDELAQMKRALGLDDQDGSDNANKEG